MILINVEAIGSKKAILDYEGLYLYLNRKETGITYLVENESVYLLVDEEIEYFKVCMEMMLALDNEGLGAKIYISQSNEQIDLNSIEITDNYQVFIQNKEMKKKYLKNRTFDKSEHFVIRAHHQMLDSILYSLSTMCFKYERNLELLFDKYYNCMTQRQIANKYDITQAAVSKKLKSSNYEMFKLIVGRL